ncbi:MAG: phage tail sheath C-terminal domain-containing protein [Bacteroidota bacterium]
MAATRLTNLRTPGVYIEEIPVFPPSVAQVATAIPVFIGYTQFAVDEQGNNIARTATAPAKAKRITSMPEYFQFFGGPNPEPAGSLSVEFRDGQFFGRVNETARSAFLMYYAVQWFYLNGGGACWIVSVGDYVASGGVIDPNALALDPLNNGLNVTDEVDEITLFVFPDAINVSSAANYYSIYEEAMDKCVMLGDRFVIMDVWIDKANPATNNITEFRNQVDSDPRLKYAAAYYPAMETNLDFAFTTTPSGTVGEANVAVTGFAGAATLEDLRTTNNNKAYNQAKQALRDIPMIMPPSPAIAGIYARVDELRGVWKAPANVALDMVLKPTIKITDAMQATLNVDENAGKSINCIRFFTGKGNLVWGARTLTGNDLEWRYVSVRRYFNMVEESVKKATEGFVFEPNDRNTWTRVKAMIENFLTGQWGAGALQGKVPEHAFYVKVGLGSTMTALDILEGRMIVEIGLAVVRPAEFIILQFMHKMAES